MRLIRHRTKPANAFTLIELTVAAGLMTIIMIMLYTIFSSAGSIFSGADSRIEIFQTARAVFDTLNRDLQGCEVDRDGNVFLGWNRAASTNNPYSLDIPTTYNTAFRNLLHDTTMTSAIPYCMPDMVWFRTTSEAANFGVPTEVIYRLRYTSSRGAYVLEKGLSRDLCQGALLGTATLSSYMNDTARFEFTPVGFHVREFQLRYYRADVDNASCDYRVYMNPSTTSSWIVNGPPGSSIFAPASADGYSHWYDYWPPQDAAGTSTSYVFDYAAGSTSISTGRRARIPAAVQVTLRIGDSSDREWTDYYSSNIIDGRDEPLTTGYVVGPEDGIKQADYRVDEVGMVFRQVIFIPSYINALGTKRSDL